MIQINYKFYGLKIGCVFTLISLVCTATIIVPIFSMIPGAIIESVAKMLVGNEPYSNVGQMTILLFSVILIISIIATVVYIKRQNQRSTPLSKKNIITIMVIFWLIVHPLVFYIYWAIELEYRSDGQLILGAIYTFPISSLWFVIVGGLIDIVKDNRIEEIS